MAKIPLGSSRSQFEIPAFERSVATLDVDELSPIGYRILASSGATEASGVNLFTIGN